MRAKFRASIVESVKLSDTYSDTYVELYPVVGGSEENCKFWNATPTGSLTMTITNPQAQEFFKQGSEYYVDFSEAAIAGDSAVAGGERSA